jgi:adenylosuccinate synthase
MLGEAPVAADELHARCATWRERLRPFVADTGAVLRAALGAGKRVLLEGAQGVMLDVDHGTYPYVTSSNAVAGSAAVGSGIAPQLIDHVVGIAKAYTTRVGSGPFPTELTDVLGDRLRVDGDEYGTNTRRPRRCGWFDAVVVKHAVATSGVDALALTKLDVLTGLDPLRICVAYDLDGVRRDTVPATSRAWDRVKPIYEELPGWREGLTSARALGDLPPNARRYVERLVELVGARLALLSVGPQRDETIRLGDVF